ncbi:MAG: hypothetical protein MJD61_00070, partial [Proteobacteria bacterium]|nr:hypothetical protein [Pseudomonadota bacterium]
MALSRSKPDILEAIGSKRVEFDPEIDPSRVDQVSVDLTLGRRFTTFKKPPEYITSVKLDPSIWGSEDLWEH